LGRWSASGFGLRRSSVFFYFLGIFTESVSST